MPNRLAHDEAAGRDIGKRVAVERVIVLIDVLPEIDRAVARHPAGDIDPGDRYPMRQVDDLGMTSRNLCVDGGAIPARRVLQSPGGELTPWLSSIELFG
jgi:hypothetical protein